jgi:diaminohydroxyphosphoribosylaminopyrimidine deaminase/5-amino-6-(5-phosphoribosylamino)uracil reductase
VDAVVDAGIATVVVGVRDPDERVSGRGARHLEEHGVVVVTGVLEDEVDAQLAPYLKHRRTGAPWVVLKMASTVDGRTAAPDGTSKYLTGPEARRDVHRLRAASDAVLVGAGTVRADDPELTVRTDPPSERQPLRVVLGEAPEHARVRPALELRGELTDVLQELGRRGVLQLLVEGGPTVAHQFHHAGLVDRYVFYLAPALFGGDDAKPVFAGPGAVSLDRLWHGKLVSVERLGDDLRLELAAA